LETKHEDNSFFPVDALDDAPVGCRIGAAKTNYGLRAGGRSQNVLRSMTTIVPMVNDFLDAKPKKQ
jgi:hypothetical protein